MNEREAERLAKGEAPLEKLDDSEPNAHEEERLKPEEDAFLSESGRILIDYLGLSASVARHDTVR